MTFCFRTRLVRWFPFSSRPKFLPPLLHPRGSPQQKLAISTSREDICNCDLRTQSTESSRFSKSPSHLASPNNSDSFAIAVLDWRLRETLRPNWLCPSLLKIADHRGVRVLARRGDSRTNVKFISSKRIGRRISSFRLQDFANFV